MLNKDHRYLKLVKYKNIENWSVSHILGMNMGFNKKYPLIPIGHIIEKSINSINIEDHVTYKQITLKINGGGTILRDVKLGKLIGTKKQFVVSAGQFIMSKIDARNGAFGVIGTDLDGAVVTADFPVFNVVKERVTPEYLTLVSSTAQFVRFAQTCSRGTTNRQRIDVNLFLSQKIPLPSLSEQQALIKSYNDKIQQAESLEKQAEQIEKDIDAYLNDELGLNTKHKEVSQTNNFKYLRFVRFKDVERWDCKQEKKISGFYKLVPLGRLCLKISTGTTPPTSRKDFFNGNIKFYTPADITDKVYLDASERYISEQAVKEKKARLFYKGDLLFVGIGSTVGKVGIVKDNLVSANQQITGITLDNSLIMPEYAFCYMNHNKAITTAEQSKSTLPIINQDKIARIPIPLPPLSTQKKIVEYILSQKEKAEQLKQQAANLRKEALEKFEKEIFE